MLIKREWLEQLIFASGNARRFTQDSPVLPDVWIRYGMLLTRGQMPVLDLLLTPHADSTAGDLYVAVERRLSYERRAGGGWQELRAGGGYLGETLALAKAAVEASPAAALPEEESDDVACNPKVPNLAYNQSTVAGCIHLDEVVRALLPLTQWWRRNVSGGGEPEIDSRAWRDAVGPALGLAAAPPRKPAKRQKEAAPPKPPLDLLWMARLVGAILAAAREPEPEGEHTWEARLARWTELTAGTPRLLEHFRRLVLAPLPKEEPDLPDDTPLFIISRNRKAKATISFSVQAMKADAARRVFHADCSSLAWAVLDSGIDATHPAFRKRTADEKTPLGDPFVDEKGRPGNGTRIDATFDFTEIRTFLAGKSSDLETRAAQVDAEVETTRKSLEEARQAVKDAPAPAADAKGKAKEKAEQEAAARLQRVRQLERQLKCLTERQQAWEGLRARWDAAERAKDIKLSLLRGRSIDWSALRPFLEVYHTPELYVRPTHEHGTHVAGILAADWRSSDPAGPHAGSTSEDLVGVCPDIRVFDFRVFNNDGEGDEFSVMAALQFLRYLNAHRELPLIHGANLSLAIRHDVANYACGRTPVCDECERVVNAGIVVVAAAGNYGYHRFSTFTASGAATSYEGYADISITDPGNADAVITVGSTHRIEPHTYGVSYFSSRGPTGDGRYKPDLVAPGEKIKAPVPTGFTIKDGTSMAAPHVSGAAALIMARYREFIGRPGRIKQILTSTATDLGRDRYFQGAGMVDVLRALQSV
ncbi:MAG TPA: S8 family peptidase [Longimicrobium sp.]|nr:S8 family peptidase [Longimicrobium sp.]